MDIPWIVSTVNILNIMSNLEEFKRWLLEFHGIDITKNDDYSVEIMQGYKFFFDTAFRALLGDLARVDWFGEDDIILQRATFVGIPLQDIPSSCERTLLLKNLWYKYFEKVLHSKSWSDLEKRLNALRSHVLSKFLELFQCWIIPKNRYSLGELCRLWSINDALVRYTDTSRGRPMPYYDLFLPVTGEYYDDKENPMDRVFRGYAYALQFLWYSLLGEDTFSKIPHLDKMHIADSIFNKEGKWQRLDEFFGILRKNVVQKIEKKIGVSLGVSDYLLFDLNSRCQPKEILDRVYSPNVPDPSYIQNRDSYEKWKKWLNLKFLWYPIDVLDTFGSRAFNGVIAFVHLVTGMAEFRKSQRDIVPIRVLRIKHPEESGNVISYALLIEGYGLISDYSGWIVFYEVGTDFSGTGGSWYRAAESVLEHYKDVVIVDEITVSSEIFEQYLAEVSPERFSEDMLVRLDRLEQENREYKERIEELEHLVSDHRGIFSELLTYYLISSGSLFGEDGLKWKKVDWNITVDGEQIDVLAIDKNDTPWIFECKFDAHKDEFPEILDQLLRKQEAVLKEYTVEPVLNLVFIRNKNNYPTNIFGKNDVNVIVLDPVLRKLLPEKNLDAIRKIIKE